MFWKSSFHATSSIDTILDKETFTLTEVLEEESLLQETKSQNKKLLDYLTQSDVLEQLIHYVINEPERGLSFAVQFRLWDFLKQSGPLHPLLASFVCKILCVLLDRKREESLECLKQSPIIIDCMIRHLDTAAIGDLLIHMVQGTDSKGMTNPDMHRWLSEQKLIYKLVSGLDSKNSIEVHNNTAQVIIDLVTAREDLFSMIFTDTQVAQLTKDMYTDETLDHLLDLMFNDNTVSSAVMAGMQVLNSLFHCHSVQTTPLPNQGFTPEIQDLWKEEHAMIQLVKNHLVSRLHQLHKLLSDSTDYSVSLTTGVITNPVGVLRLRLLQLLVSLAESRDPAVFAAFSEEGIISTCLDLFFTYKWNNFLHSSVARLIEVICKPDDPAETYDILKTVINDYQLPERIIAASAANDESVAAGHGRHGYMGHVMCMATNLNIVLSSQPADLHIVSGWTEFVHDKLNPHNDLISKPLGGHRPALGTYDSDDDYREMDNSDAMELSKYICQEIGSNDLPDKFGNNDDDDDDDEDFEKNFQAYRTGTVQIDLTMAKTRTNDKETEWDAFGTDKKNPSEDDWQPFETSNQMNNNDDDWPVSTSNSSDWPEGDPFNKDQWDPFDEKR
eukprot:Ihof_evm4s274 gene=Ihof_evmTU4s274